MALGLPRRLFRIVKRVAVGVYSDGFIHAGNLAYLTLLALFPFFIIVAALAQLFGRSEDGGQAVAQILRLMPHGIANMLHPAIDSVLAARTGPLLWLGAVVGLWTVGSFIETIRDILRRAYGTQPSGAFWHYRLGSVAIIVVAVMLMMLAFAAQVALTGVEQFLDRVVPMTHQFTGWIGLSRLVPTAVVFVALYVLFYTLTPSAYRYSKNRKWPGAAFTAGWWLAVTVILPLVLGRLGNYNRTYGSLAGIVVMLFFFWLIGFGLVIGAHLNAALAESPSNGLKDAAEETEETAWPV
ncbi:YihY/virulence factor BrkB family protein [Sphingomonas abietis]|uniref:YihY/virulence factor BrkB family protein n=1 Tax=Sphingomonas abietis TaxID=3012344 RepID=A0ABY7NNG6_9SPHN|nr:YihY/virulence factor BrkB family protein [Sphingomonas abietis]WBO23067.1 YihY/virulence factor BrkB family protein [Sphingomonas abietis]